MSIWDCSPMNYCPSQGMDIVIGCVVEYKTLVELWKGCVCLIGVGIFKYFSVD